MTDEIAQSAVVETCLAEFNAMRKEIADRSATQNTLINLDLTAIAGVVSLVATDRANESLLLLLTAICSALGMLWADHARTIRNLAKYINNDLRRILRTVAKEEAILSWEERSGHYRKGEKVTLTYRLPLLLVFIGPPLAALMVTALDEPGIANFDPALMLYWIGGLLITTYMTIILVNIQFSAHQKRHFRARASKG